MHLFWLNTKRLYGLCVLLLILISGLIFGAARTLGATHSASLEADVWALAGQLIVLDAGHGGIDSGCAGANGESEAAINLAVAKKLQTLLEQAGATVIMTREDEKSHSDNKRSDLQWRVDLANASGAGLVLSLHCNASNSAVWRGAQVFYAAGDAAGARMADLTQQALAAELGNSTRQALPHPDSFLLKNLEPPAVLVEMGFLSNAEEEALLADPRYQNRIAWALFGAVTEYFTAGEAENVKNMR